jgi:acyl-CoA reductase-like NAD-dependent aldehyde dehydrogenase
VLKLVRCADADPAATWEGMAPLLADGHVAVVLLLYCEARRLPVRLLARLGLIAAALPAGVLNLLTGLGLEAGLALARDPLSAWPPPCATESAPPLH